MSPEADPSNPALSELESGVDPLLKQAFNLQATRSVGPPSSVLLSLLQSLPSVPRVLLRSAAGESAESVVHVRSDELPRGPTGRYQLHGEIARGGMGIVVRGRDADLGRDLAVKILLQCHQSRAEIVERFVEEAQIAGQLQHPGVVPVYELGQFEDGRPFFTMKLVKGKTLAALLTERKSVEEERRRFLAIFEQICQTLAYAHARGVIHRDLKPSNVMVGAFGEVQVMDWGLAKVLKEGGVDDEQRAQAQSKHAGRSVIQTVRSSGSGSGSDTQLGSVMGTPAYMAPEQARGDVELVDERADVFGLGAILCEMLTGEPPFRGTTKEAQRQARSGSVEDAMARLERSGADAGIVCVARECLESEPGDRPRHAGEVAAKVAAYLESVEGRLRQAEVERETEKARAVEAERARREALARAAAERKARRATVVLGATVLAAVVAGGGTWMKLKSDGDARLSKVTGDVHAALEKVATLREQARSADHEGLATWNAARVEAERARALLEATVVDEELQGKVERLLVDLAAEERDRNLLAAIDAARLAGTVRNDRGDYAQDRSVPLYRTALQAWGITPGQMSAAQAAELIRAARPQVQREILGALAHWIRLTAVSDDSSQEPVVVWLKDAVAAADDDPWRKAIRESWRADDIARCSQLATEVDVTQQPISMLVDVASGLFHLGEEKTARALLGRLWRQFPGDFWVNNELANCASSQQKPDIQSAILHYTVAVATRPRSTGARVNLWSALQDARRFDEAEAELRTALEIEPGEPRLLSLLGMTLFKQGKTQEGIELIEKVLREHPDLAQAHVLLGDVLEEQKKLEPCLAAREEAARLEPNNAGVQNRLGTGYANLGRIDEAIAAFEQAVQIDPQNVQAQGNLGRAYRERGRVDEAIAALRKVAKLTPDSSEAHANLAEALLRNRDFDEALPHARKAIALMPESHEGHHILGQILLQKDLPEEAIEPLQTAIRIDPNSFEAYAQLGEALRGLGRKEEAEKAYTKAIDLNPDYFPAQLNLGFLLEELHRPEEAAKAFQEGLKRRPNAPGALHHLGRVLLLTGQVDEGIAAIQRSIALDSASAQAYFDLGRALADLRQRWAEAADSFQKAVDRDPQYAPSWSNLGFTLHRAGRIKEARTALERALSLDPTAGKTHFNMAQTHMTLGENSEAIDSYRKSIQLDPSYAEAHCNLGHALLRAGHFAEALESLRLGHTLGASRPGWKYPSADWVKKAERYIEAEKNLPALIDGKQVSIEETADGADVCYRKGRFADAARLWERAFAGRPELAGNLVAGNRYNAACAAALAASGKDPAAASPEDRARLRRKALEWLGADLELRRSQAQSGDPTSSESSRSALKHWQEDSDLAGLRDEESLAKLPAGESTEWRRLWTAIASLIQEQKSKGE